MVTVFELLYRKPYRSKRCRNCELPKYYGSTFLAEKFGKEEANRLSSEWEGRQD